MKNRFFAVKTAVAVFVLLAAFCASVAFGAQSLSAADMRSAFTDSSSFFHIILFSLRLPRSILALFTGALLASSGACFQLFFRNALAEPGIIGISSGATLGAVIAQTAGVSAVLFGAVAPVNMLAFVGAIAAGAVVTLISGKAGGRSGVTLLLCGTALGTLYASVSSVILLTKSRELHGIYTWILGSFNGRGWTEVRFIALPAALSFILMLICASRLDIMTGGEQTAMSLGLEVAHLRTLVLVSGSLAVSAAVCAGGTIQFVGLIAPHIVRKVYGEIHTKAVRLIPLSALFGAILLLLSDTAARLVIAPSELPAGLITSLLGAPFFISLIFTGEKRR